MAGAGQQKVVVGTAGHIDHGKTRLIEALTGIDCDRWAEEKSRGITIDLGFAHLHEGDLQLGFVDVPGHERFLHNALAGLGGVRLMLLVVAADEGVKPQTREHLAICSLLGIEHGAVALTKKDLVDDDLLELAELEVEELLEETPFSGSPVVPVSSHTGEGVERLRSTLLEMAAGLAAPAALGLPFRLPIDRSFHLKGMGVVVTGTAASGEVRAGETLAVLPGDGKARVRSLQSHGEARDRIEAGERGALQLSGVELEAVPRGAQLTAAGAFRATTTLAAETALLADAPEPLTTFTPVRFHLYSSEVVGKLRALPRRPGEAGVIEPGASGLVEIRLARPVVAVRGDRFILRRPSPALTLGGGRILDPRWRRRRGASLSRSVARLEEKAEALALWVEEARERGTTAAELAPRLGEETEAVARSLDELAAAGRLLAVEAGQRRWLHPEACRRVLARGRRVLAAFFEKDRMAAGMPKAELLARTLPKRAMDLAEVYLRWMQAEGVLTLEAGLVDVPGRGAALTREESELSRAVLERVAAAGLTPPPPEHLDRELGAKRQIVAGVVRYLVARGKLVRLPSGLLLAASAVDDLRRQLLASGLESITVGEFKERFGLSRKWAIPLLEHLDSTGFTRRVGDERQIVRPKTKA